MKTLEDKQQARNLLDEHLQHITPTWPALKVVAFQEHIEQLPPRYLAAYGRDQIAAHLELIGRRGDGIVEVGFAEHQEQADGRQATDRPWSDRSGAGFGKGGGSGNI